MIAPEENYLPEEEIIPQKRVNLDEFISRPPFKIGVGVLFAILAILIGLTAYRFFGNINKPPVTATVTPAPVINIVTPAPNLSKWATDSAVLKERDNLSALEKDLKNIDLNETNLTFPTLDFNINFDKPQ